MYMYNAEKGKEDIRRKKEKKIAANNYNIV
jgi:hypothetical protein